MLFYRLLPREKIIHPRTTSLPGSFPGSFPVYCLPNQSLERGSWRYSDPRTAFAPGILPGVLLTRCTTDDTAPNRSRYSFPVWIRLDCLDIDPYSVDASDTTPSGPPSLPVYCLFTLPVILPMIPPWIAPGVASRYRFASTASISTPGLPILVVFDPDTASLPVYYPVYPYLYYNPILAATYLSRYPI